MKRVGKILAILLSLAIIVSGLMLPASAATADPTREAAHAAVARRAGAESMVLLKNDSKVLPLAKNAKVALFGKGAVNTIYGGTGSGAVNNQYNISILAGFRDNGVILDANVNAAYAGSGSTEIVPNEALITQAALDNDVAVYVITRTSGEGSDRSVGTNSNTDVRLQANEVSTINLLKAKFDKVVVLLNVGGIVDLTNVAVDGVDSILAIWQGGQEAGNSAYDVVFGDVNPSGKLNDTWAAYDNYYTNNNFSRSYNDYGLDPALNTGLYRTSSMNPNTVVGTFNASWYQEGIYVGYRYFDTFNVPIIYPFGHGLSYTDFAISNQSVSVNTTTDIITVSARVTNTGTVAGKEVVQVYFSAPDATGVEKPYQELAGFAKTNLLAPGANQTVTITFSTSDLSSYNESLSAYVVDAGQYLFRVGNSSRNTKVVAKSTVASAINVEQLTKQLDMTANAKATLVGQFAPLSKFNSTGTMVTPYSYAVEADEITAASTVNLGTNAFTVAAAKKVVEAPKELPAPKYPSTTFKLQAVADGTITMEEYVAQFTTLELAGISTGSNAGSYDGQQLNNTWLIKTKDLRGSAQHTNSIVRLGNPSLACPDGPAGVRITRVGTYTRLGVISSGDQGGTSYFYTNYAGQAFEHNATRWPNTSAQACSWDVALLREVGQTIGKELQIFNADIWLAPAFNIHRNPRNGRNFEYFAEDPYLAGKMAVANTLGVQSVKDEFGRGPGVSIKHFFANNQETSRKLTDAILAERTAREIYLKAFELCVKEAEPYTIMSSYNVVNGNYTSCSYDLLENITRGEWGYKGFVMTDWNINGTTGNTLKAGNDVIMPGTNQPVSSIMPLVGAEDPMNSVSKAQLQKNVMRVMNVSLRTPAMTEFITTTAKITNVGPIRPNEDITIDVTTPFSVTSLPKLESEYGKAVSIKSYTSKVVNNKRVWSLVTSVGTAGNGRILSVLTKDPANIYPKTAGATSNSGYEYSGATVKFDAVSNPLPTASCELVSFTSSVTSATANAKFNVTVVSKELVHSIKFVNILDKEIGKTLVSKTTNAGTVTWVYSVSFGTAGKDRLLVAIPYDKTGAEGMNRLSVLVDIV